VATSTSPTWARRIWPLAAFQLAFIAGATQIKSVGNALVLGRMDALALPYLYLAGAVVVGILAVVPRPAVDSKAASPGRYASVGAVLALLLAVASALDVRGVPLAVYLLAEVGTTFVALRFWSQTAARFDAREARRAFPFLNALAMAGGIVGGLLLQALAEPLGTTAVLAEAALLLVLAAVLWRRALPMPPAQARAPMGRARARWRDLTLHPYPRLLGVLVFALAILSTFADYLFRLRAGGALEEAALASLFGELQVWLSLSCLLFQLLLAERLLGRLGVLRYLALIPLLLLPLLVWSLLSSELWPAFTLRLVDHAVGYTLLPVGMQLLYAAVPEDRRDAARAVMDGLVRKAGLGLAAVLLIVAGTGATVSSLAISGLVLCGVVAVVLVKLRPEYVAALGAQVGAVLEKRHQKPVVGDLRLLSAALQGPDPRRALRAVEVMESWQVPLAPQLPALLSHPHPDVVLRGIELALELEAREVGAQLEQLLITGPESTRDEAVWALSRLAPDRAARLLPTLMRDPDLPLRCAAIGALLRTPHRPLALTELQALLTRRELASVEERVEVARLLGLLRDPQFTPELSVYLSDPELAVRRSALRAVGESGEVGLAPRLLEGLGLREERPDARAALIALGDAVTGLVQSALDDRTRPLGMRLHLPRVLRGIGTPLALEALLFSNVRDDARLHHRIGAELLRLHEEHPEHPIDAGRVHQAIARQVRVAESLAGPLGAIVLALGPRHLLTRAVQGRMDQALELSFFLFGLLFPRDVMRRVHQHLVGGDGRQRALALELLDNLLSEEQKALVEPLLNPSESPSTAGSPVTLNRHLRTLSTHEDLVLRSLARAVARLRGLYLSSDGADDMDLSTVERMFLLQEVSVFAQSDVDDIAAVAAMARETVVAVGERLWSQGDPGESLCVIIEGQVDAFRFGEHIARFGPKQTLGEVNLLDGAPRPTDMVAAEVARLLVIDRRDFLDLLADRPELLAGFFRAVSDQLQTFIDLPRRKTGERLSLG